MERVQRRCGFMCGVEVEAEGSRGGLCLAWKEDIQVNLRSFSKWHIHVIIKEDDIVGEWRFTGIYGSPYLKDKNTVWNLLRRLAHEDSYPWLVEGDFNEILYSFAKSGGTQRDKKRMDAFREVLDDCQLARAKEREKEGLKKELSKKLELLLEGEVNDDTMAEIIDTKIHLNLEIDKDEMYWEQRARANWLKLGDKNSAYFHKWAIVRRRANTISKLETEEGREIEEGVEIMDTASTFFQDLFKAEDIQTALKETGPTKALGVDGFPALFFQRYWHIVGNDVTDYFLGVLNDKKPMEDFNKIDIVLIPKILKPTKMINFRPISLCTVVYKVIAKAIVHRLQNVIDKCVGKVQRAFVPGRLISDNVLLAYEILHTLR
ncbi:reverse transcriptase [Gossypium australe]|uniref:Reverse transcriptase n=1 Tax=Gossypium australe TaxID=47621 RepID=A0A5B6V0V0_9ROSI|nr:reverse transcriptase [Gossypium australe]